jgi:predicted Zn finger-like uncharacterized protein
MPENIIQCPQCQRQLRVPEEMLGRLVKCPTCSTTFTVGAGGEPQPPQAPLPAGDAPPPTPPPEYYPATPRLPPQPQDYYPDPRNRAASLLLPPGICLLITGILAVFGSVFSMAVTYLDPKNLERTLAQFNFKGEAPPLGLMLGMQAVFVVISFVTFLAGIQMLRKRTYGLVMVGAILAMINISNFCCCLGLPFGIWALIVLVRPEVREAFQ